MLIVKREVLRGGSDLRVSKHTHMQNKKKATHIKNFKNMSNTGELVFNKRSYFVCLLFFGANLDSRGVFTNRS